jgi:hypothetical protein
VSAGRATLALASLAVAACAGTTPPPAEHAAITERMAGETARRYDDPRTAAALYARAARSAAGGDRPLLAADAACRQGLALIALGEPAKAEAPLLDAAALARADDPRLAARALLALARARRDLGAGDARGPLAEARELATAAGDDTGAALAELGLGALGPRAEARARYAAAEKLAGGDPAVAGPLRLNLARLDEREGRAAEAREGYRAAIAPLAASDDRPALLAALAAAARLADADADPAAAAEAADLHRRAAAVAAGLGRDDVARAELRAAEAAGARGAATDPDRDRARR